MSGRTVSDNMKQAVFSQETSNAFIVLLTISHPDWVDDIRVASDSFEVLPVALVRGVISNGDEYIYTPFSINLPAQDDSGIARATISIDNINRELTQQLRQSSSAVDITMQVVLSSDPDTIEVTVSDFKLERVTYDAFTVSGEISVQFFDLEPFPSQRFAPSKFPAIF